MMFRKIFCLLVVSFTALYSNPTNFPLIIDFQKIDFLSSYHSEPHYTWSWKLSNVNYKEDMRIFNIDSFNGAPEIGVYFAFLKQALGIDTVIETGTFHGSTTKFFANCFKEVHTIEIVENNYNKAKTLFAVQPHVYCHLGSSERILNQILPDLKDRPTIFYLDAHWYNYWPIFDELKEISRTHKDNCIIIIDDIKVPSRKDIRFDAYDLNGERIECSYKQLKKHINLVFSKYSIHYLIPKNTKARAKLVIIPERFKKIIES